MIEGIKILFISTAVITLWEKKKKIWIHIGPTFLPSQTCYSFVETLKCETYGEILGVLEAALKRRVFQASH